MSETNCLKCQDRGIVYKKCCDGSMCGCMGYPYDADFCDCGARVNKDDLTGWEKEMLYIEGCHGE